MSHNKPADRRFNLMTQMCYRWVRDFEPERFAKFKRIAEIEIPPEKGGRYKHRNAQGREKVNAATA